MSARPVWTSVGVVALAAAGASGWLIGRDDTGQAASPESTGPVATATVELGTLTATQTWSATLGHGEPTTVSAPAAGVLTRVAAAGTDVTRGSVLFHVDEQPVALLLGAVPMYRDLDAGAVGADVAQLEENLAALGYTGFTADDEYTSATADAVEEWQEDLGVASPDGVAGRSDVVFLPAGGRVDAQPAAVGDTLQAGAAVVELTGTAQVVDLEVDQADADLVAAGTAVTVVLPDGTELAGTVESASVSPATDGADAAAASGETEDVTIAEIVLADPGGLAAAEPAGTTVDVELAVDSRDGVLTVPVNALLALAEGGYGLELVAGDGTTSVVAVETGLFADGRVEVSGDGVAEGVVVGTAGR
ncbi:HlyD family efflux transporter periplasmic adaptor subunit [Jiangella ureilytica]|uniref:HlyD family efflux transporter periplasmic adaptor subunit n=1 Tax=Jiangella ureilytica TaxID=2530374 RepID=A0A4R4RTF8_9ACTN|nr:peptidoglycan-binding protein [Jiangella ureilytica]TDC51783.1 HlyD family efflux transporter periplasmic adaptor subunit [Jiangella ureilytica]